MTLQSADQRIGRSQQEECLSLILRIGIAGSAKSPRDQTDISDVASKLHTIRDTLLGWILLLLFFICWSQASSFSSFSFIFVVLACKLY